MKGVLSILTGVLLWTVGARGSDLWQVSLEGTWKARAGDLAPADAYVPGFDDGGWDTLQVPGNWHLQGADYAGVVWYRRHFKMDPAPQGRLVKLAFEAVDYAADVWLNGDYLGHHEGYFEPFSFYIERHLAAGGDNVLSVRVNSPNETPEAWSLHKRLIKGVLSHHDTRPGGAWSTRGQEQNTGGIWGAVTLSSPREADIGPVRIVTRPDSGDAWTAAIDASFVQGGSPADLSFEARVEPVSFTATGPLPASASTVVSGASGAAHLELTVAHPRLWWTWDQGRPDLYRAIVRAFKDGRLVAESKVRFGFRTVEVDASTRQWRLNGRGLFLRGTNYISSQWLSEMTPERSGFDLELMKHANINAIRVHAHLEAEAFYSQCDEKGMLVWQDFPLQWGYQEDTGFLNEASRQAAGMVRWLFNHPSIAAWTMQNEPPFDADWMKWKYRDYRPDQNKLLNDALYQVVSEADPTRWVHAYSTTGEHQWLGWYSGSWLDFAKPSKQAIVSEYGAQALPGLPSLRKIFTESELWPKSDADWEKWDYHNFQRHETFDLAGVRQGANTADWIRNTQAYQAKLTQFAAENYRRQKYAPVTAIFQFLFNEDWPSVNWGIVDYWRNPKPGYDALRIAYQPVLPSIAWTRDRWDPGETPEMALWVVNDLRREFPKALLNWSLRDSAHIIEQGSLAADIAGDSATAVRILTFPDLAEGQYTLAVALRDAAGAPLGENAYDFSVVPAPPPEPKK